MKCDNIAGGMFVGFVTAEALFYGSISAGLTETFTQYTAPALMAIVEGVGLAFESTPTVVTAAVGLLGAGTGALAVIINDIANQKQITPAKT